MTESSVNNQFHSHLSFHTAVLLTRSLSTSRPVVNDVQQSIKSTYFYAIFMQLLQAECFFDYFLLSLCVCGCALCCSVVNLNVTKKSLTRHQMNLIQNRKEGYSHNTPLNDKLFHREFISHMINYHLLFVYRLYRNNHEDYRKIVKFYNKR